MGFFAVKVRYSRSSLEVIGLEKQVYLALLIRAFHQEGGEWIYKDLSSDKLYIFFRFITIITMEIEKT